jgi:hypothetical protein
MNLTWKINSLKSKPDDGAVIEASWQLTAVEGEAVKTQYGKSAFQVNSSDPSFIPYADLTEEKVLQWVWDSMDKDEVESDLGNKLNRQPKYNIGKPF